MKKALLFCFISLFISLNAIAQENYPGQVCESAIPITSLPYFTFDNTINYGDDYNGAPGCEAPGPFLNGDDVVYSFTASDNIPLRITLTATFPYSGIYVYDNCENIGISCLAGASNTNSDVPSVIILPQITGNTYYIVISTYPIVSILQNTGYNLTVAKATCTNFVATYSVVSDCSNGSQFFVNANITNMGTASSILVTSNQEGTVPQTITEVGTIQFGPYLSGTNVLLNLQNESDPNCFSYSPYLTFYCPATNNLCSGAIPITCGSVESQTTVGATTDGAPTFTCGTDSGSGGLWYTFIGTGDKVTFSLCNSVYNTKIQVFTGTCGNFTCVGGNDDFCNVKSELSIISALGTVYYIYVYGYLSSQGVFSLSTTCEPAPTAPSNDDCQFATVVPVNNNLECTLITPGTILGATPSPQAGSCVMNNYDVWYQFVATHTKHKISLLNVTGSTLNITHAIYKSTSLTDPCANLVLLNCFPLEFSYPSNFVPGQTYYIRIFSSDTTLIQNTTFDLCISTPIPPINDECSNAISLIVNPDSSCSNFTSGTILSATQSPQTANCGASSLNIQYDVWYKFIATESVHKISLLNVTGSHTDIKAAVFSSSVSSDPCENLTFVTCNQFAQNLVPGQTYFIKIYYSSIAAVIPDTTFDVCVSILPPPPLNDECTTAISLTLNPDINGIIFTEGTIAGATASQQVDNCIGTPDDDVWYQFIATHTSHYIELKNIIGAAINKAVFTSSDATNPCSNLTLVDCGNSNLSYIQNLIPGQVYFIRIYSNISISFLDTTFELSVNTPPSAPANDECSDATTINVNAINEYTITTEGNIASATPSSQEDSCSGIPNDDVWFQFIATSQKHTIDLLDIVGSTTNLVHSVYTSTNTINPCGFLTLLYCSLPNSSFNDTFVIGQMYYIRVYSMSDTPGAFANFKISLGKANSSIITNTTLYTNSELVENILVNTNCASVYNITSGTGTDFGSVNGIGYFNRGDSDFPFQEGIVMSTGNVLNIPGYNTSILSEGITSWLGDTDLETIISAGTGQSLNSFNASKIEFNFVPENNFISFDFIFASEEYGSFQCAFADAFAFLLTDVATGVTTNLAVVPGTTFPVSVITIRDQTYNPSCASENAAYFDSFYLLNSSSYGAPFNFNGVTHPMTASSAVIPNNLYKIKLVVADRSDRFFDSAVFLEGGSFALSNQCPNAINLVAFVDANSNGIKEPTELDYTQGTFNYVVNNSTETSINYSPSGVLYIPVATETDSFDFSYQVYPEIATYFNCTTLHSDIIYNPTGNNTYYFPINNTLPYNDVEVSLTATAGPNPGYSYTNTVSYKNNGLTAASGTLTYEKNPALSINSISPTGAVTTTNGFAYAYTNLLPNETRTITIGLQTPTIPSVALGDLLTNTVSAASTGDINPANNSTELAQIVTASYDPNDKMEAQGPEILFSSFGADDYLYYTIRFQNTGTANAETVVITDLLSADLDEQSIRMISASHDYTMNRMGNDLEWTFEAINLVPTIVNEAASQGYVHFKIKPKPGYMAGDIIPNTAQIYFDFNDPIITNTFETEFVATLGVADFTTDNLIVYPNPATNQVSISVQNSADAIAEIRLTDMLGKVVFQQKGTHTQTTIDLSGLSKGVYMLEVQTENKFSVVKKLVKN